MSNLIIGDIVITHNNHFGIFVGESNEIECIVECYDRTIRYSPNEITKFITNRCQVRDAANFIYQYLYDSLIEDPTEFIFGNCLPDMMTKMIVLYHVDSRIKSTELHDQYLIMLQGMRQLRRYGKLD